MRTPEDYQRFEKSSSADGEPVPSPPLPADRPHRYQAVARRPSSWAGRACTGEGCFGRGGHSLPPVLVIMTVAPCGVVIAVSVGSDRTWTGHGASTIRAPQMTRWEPTCVAARTKSICTGRWAVSRLYKTSRTDLKPARQKLPITSILRTRPRIRAAGMTSQAICAIVIAILLRALRKSSGVR
jgi:hypothetical protein